jgi:hypothetical protein
MFECIRLRGSRHVSLLGLAMMNVRTATMIAVTVAGVLVACGGATDDETSGEPSVEETQVVQSALSCVGANLASDPGNCGQCGRDCLGGACSAGACQPVALAPASRDTAWDVSVDRDNVYWRAEGKIRFVPKRGGTVATLATTTGQPPVARGRVVSAGGYAYFLDGTSVLRVPRSGGSADVLATNEVAPGSLATDGTSLFWGTATSVRRMAVGGGTPVTMADNLRTPYDLSVDTSRVWFGVVTGSGWSTGTAIYGIPKAAVNGAPTRRASTSAMAVRTDASNVYYLQATTRSISTIPKGLGRAVSILPWAGTNGTGPDTFVVDATHVVYADREANAVRRVPKAGGVAALVASVPLPTDIAVDDSAVYVTTESGAVYRVAK